MSHSSDLILMHRSVQAHAPNNCVIRGQTLPCIATSEERNTDFEFGPKTLQINLTIFILRKDLIDSFGAVETTDGDLVTVDTNLVTADTDEVLASRNRAPVRTGEVVKFKGRSYRATKIKIDHGDASFRIELDSEAM